MENNKNNQTMNEESKDDIKDFGSSQTKNARGNFAKSQKSGAFFAKNKGSYASWGIT